MAAPASLSRNNLVLVSIDNPVCDATNWYRHPCFRSLECKAEETALKVLEGLKNGFELVFKSWDTFPNMPPRDILPKEAFESAQCADRAAEELNESWKSCTEKNQSPVVWLGIRKAREVFYDCLAKSKLYTYSFIGKPLFTMNATKEKGYRSPEHGHGLLSRVVAATVNDISFYHFLCILDVLGVYISIQRVETASHLESLKLPHAKVSADASSSSSSSSSSASFRFGPGNE